MHTYEVRSHKNRRGIDLISDVLPFGRLWYCARIVFDCRLDTMMRARWILSPLFYPSQALCVERLRQRGLRLARPEKVRPVGLAEQTKEQRRIVFRIHVVHDTASQNRWTPQQALQQLFVLLILRLCSRHAFPVEAQLADHFWLDLHPIDFNA